MGDAYDDMDAMGGSPPRWVPPVGEPAWDMKAGRVIQIPEEPLERIANALETMAKPSAPAELINEHATMTQAFGELCKIMAGMGIKLERHLSQDDNLDALGRAKAMRAIAQDMVRYGEQNLQRFKLHEDSSEKMRAALRDVLKGV